jgi:hypothetical protein
MSSAELGHNHYVPRWYQERLFTDAGARDCRFRPPFRYDACGLRVRGVRLIRGCAPAVTGLLLSVFMAGATSAATGSFEASAFAACVRHRGIPFTGPSSDPLGMYHPRPTASVDVVLRGGEGATVFFYPSATSAHAGAAHYAADWVNYICSQAAAKLRQTCALNIRAKTQPLARYTVANVFVQFEAERPSAKLRGLVASCLHS